MKTKTKKLSNSGVSKLPNNNNLINKILLLISNSCCYINTKLDIDIDIDDEFSNSGVSKRLDEALLILSILRNKRLITVLYAIREIEVPYKNEIRRVCNISSHEEILRALAKLTQINLIENVEKVNSSRLNRLNNLTQFGKQGSPPKDFYRLTGLGKKLFYNKPINEYFNIIIPEIIKFNIKDHNRIIRTKIKETKLEVKELEKVSPRELEFMKVRKLRLEQDPSFIKGIVSLYNNDFVKKLSKENFLKRMDYVLKEEMGETKG